MSIDYERSFKKLVEQINRELGWAEEKDDGSPNSRGVIFAYRSIKGLADKLKDGTYDFNEIPRAEETVIVDRQGNYCDGVLCNGCSGACPYVVEDVDGRSACYENTWMQCTNR